MAAPQEIIIIYWLALVCGVLPLASSTSRRPVRDDRAQLLAGERRERRVLVATFTPALRMRVRLRLRLRGVCVCARVYACTSAFVSARACAHG